MVRKMDYRNVDLATTLTTMTKLQDIFLDVSSRMSADLQAARTGFTHSGLKGNANEQAVANFLRQYLPRSLDVNTGTIVDADGSQSRQLDVVISDADRTPVFFEAGGARIIPAEGAVAVVEVKATLSKEELQKSYTNMKSVKKLKKSAFSKQPGLFIEEHQLYGKSWTYWPTQYFLFAFESGDLETIKSELDTLQAADLPEERIDTICVLSRGVIMNQLADGRFATLPDATSTTFVGHSTQHALLLFYTMISLILNHAKAPIFNPLPYIEGVVFS